MDNLGRIARETTAALNKTSRLVTPKSATAIDPKTGNPVVRDIPEHRLKSVRAKGDRLVVVGEVGGTEVEYNIDRKEAINRAKALSEMAKHAKYSSDRNELLDLVEQVIKAIKQAKENSGKKYTGVSVSMAGIAKKAPNG